MDADPPDLHDDDYLYDPFPAYNSDSEDVIQKPFQPKISNEYNIENLLTHDDHAFDDLPPQDLSDSEDAELHTVDVIQKPFQPEIFNESSNIQDVLTQTCCGDAFLPPYIEVLRLQVDSRQLVLFSLGQQHQLVAGLSRRYPQLREVQFGYPANNWKRRDGMWKRAGVNSDIQVLP
ncbi:hypothetical protein C8R44DRAFT_868606 [Mycena epipterygia]|nr:hypothetical protein C8R44DRAFT_868606 [Mycena epipterygia]